MATKQSTIDYILDQLSQVRELGLGLCLANMRYTVMRRL